VFPQHSGGCRQRSITVFPLDCSENEAVALYFACVNQQTDGLVCMINPATLNRSAIPGIGRTIDLEGEPDTVEP